MIIEKNSSIFSFPQNYTLVNPVNCVGVMGKGLALLFKNKHPQHFKDYQVACKNNKIQIGKCWIWEQKDLISSTSIVCFPTKDHWRNPSKYEYIKKGLDSLKNLVLLHNIEYLVIPPLGCGCGGLNWKIVKSLIYDSLSISECNVYLCNYC